MFDEIHFIVSVALASNKPLQRIAMRREALYCYDIGMHHCRSGRKDYFGYQRGVIDGIAAAEVDPAAMARERAWVWMGAVPFAVKKQAIFEMHHFVSISCLPSLSLSSYHTNFVSHVENNFRRFRSFQPSPFPWKAESIRITPREHLEETPVQPAAMMMHRDTISEKMLFIAKVP